MSIFLRLLLLHILSITLTQTLQAQKLKKFNKKVGTIDSVAILPVICNLAGAIRSDEYITNDDEVCRGTCIAFIDAAKEVLGGRCALQLCGGYNTHDPKIDSALFQDFQRLRKMKHLPDTFELSKEKLDLIEKSNYPYVLINYAEGYYLTKEYRDARNAWLIPASAALALITAGSTAIVPKNGVVYFHSLLYDVRAKRVLYFKHAKEYTSSMYNQRLQATFLRTIYRKLYYKTKAL